MNVPGHSSPKPDVVGDVDERFTMPARNVSPHPVSRRMVLLLFAFIGLAFAGTGVGTLVSLHYSDSNTKRLDSRSKVRDAERDAFEKQISALTKRLDQTQQALQATQTRNTKAICTLAIGSIQGNVDSGKTIDPLVIEFTRQYGCTIPAGLLPPPVTP